MRTPNLSRWLLPRAQSESPAQLVDGSRVAVMGGGPAGSLFSFFLLETAERAGISVQVDIYEPRDFNAFGPPGCNMCGGIISESLVQTLALEGINLPPTVVQRGIEAYVLHTHEGSVRIATPVDEVRIAAVYRGAGPLGTMGEHGQSFDQMLLDLALGKGAERIKARVNQVGWDGDRMQVSLAGAPAETYDLLAVATGVNSAALKLFEGLGLAYRPPGTVKTIIRDYYLGAERIERHMTDAMHVFLLDIPRLQFAAAIPKGDFVTLVLLGEAVDGELVEAFLHSPTLKRAMPPDWTPSSPACHCSPRLIIGGAQQPFGNRIVFIGDCASNRLYKDGIGGAYRAAKAAASTAVFHGVSAEDFRRHYWPTCRAIDGDNRAGKFIFWLTRVVQKHSGMRRGVLRMAAAEQVQGGRAKRMSLVLWNTFSGSVSYREILMQALHPAYLARLTWCAASCALPGVLQSRHTTGFDPSH